LKLPDVPVERPLEDAFKVNGPTVPPLRSHPEKVAIPADAVTGFAEHAASVPEPEFTARVIGAVPVVTRSPLESSMATEGWVANAVPKLALPGDAVKTSCVAVPATVKLLLTAVVSPASVACRVNDPWVPRLIAQPENETTPATAFTGLEAHDATEPEPDWTPRVTADASVVTVLPPVSSTATTGWVTNAAPPVLLPGDVVNTSCAAGPGVIVNELPVPVVRPLADAFRVKLPWVPEVSPQPENVAMPPTAVTGLVVQLRVPVPELTAKVTDAVLVVTRFPPASATQTTG
jgi:hypothetical protein